VNDKNKRAHKAALTVIGTVILILLIAAAVPILLFWIAATFSSDVVDIFLLTIILAIAYGMIYYMEYSS
jgi:hypothetical protein